MSRAAGKDTHSLIATQSGWTHSRFPLARFYPMENESQPDMRETLKAGYRFGSIIGWKQFQSRLCLSDQAWLARDTELLLETGMDYSD